MENSDLIISINTDKNANIFDVCHYAVNGDIYEIIPRLVKKIEERGRQRHV
jgi:electron transfer flavoprotein alpha subunit